MMLMRFASQPVIQGSVRYGYVTPSIPHAEPITLARTQVEWCMRQRSYIEECRRPHPDRWVTEADAADMLHVSKDTLARHRKQGDTPPFIYDERHRIAYRLRDILAFRNGLYGNEEEEWE